MKRIIQLNAIRCNNTKSTIKMTNIWRLDLLPCEVLLTIFDYCDEFDLAQLSQVCKRFYDIVHTDTVWVKKGKEFLVTNQMSERFRKRCNPILSPCSKWLVSNNWKYGRYGKRILRSQNVRLMPWLQMTDDTLWWCGGNLIHSFNRTEGLKAKTTYYCGLNNIDYRKLCFDLTNPGGYGADICKFVVRRNIIISGHRDGSIKWLNGSYSSPIHHNYRTIKRMHVHTSDINAIDATSQNIISGSNEGVIKIQKNIDISEGNIGNIFDSEIYTTIKIASRVQSLAFDPTGARFTVGLCGTNMSPLHIIDMERYTVLNTMQHEWTYGAGILDMVWDDPNTFLTCGYDTYIRKWDMRTGNCVRLWMDPTDASLYCISSDHQYTMITGTQYNCMAVLWDQRQTDCVQLYYMSPQTISLGSPIYSLRFDSSRLYCATDQHLFQLTFTNNTYQMHNYKPLYYNTLYAGHKTYKR